MTTIPGYNQILQQSSIAQELSNQGNSLKPSPDQAILQQQAQEVVQGSTVQGSEASEHLKKQKEKRAQKQTAGRGKKNKNQDKEMALDPDDRGRLLDTTV